MNQQARFEAFYADQHGMPIATVVSHRMVDSYDHPHISSHYRTFKAAEDGAKSRGAPVEQDERAEFEIAFVVQDGVFFSAERNEYRSMNGRDIERTDAMDLNLRLQGWKARAALELKP